MHLQNQIEKNNGLLLLFMAIAYLFSMGIRMYWPMYFADNEAFGYAGQLMINTNDGYFFATGAMDMLNGVVAEDAQRASAYSVSKGLVLLTAYATKFSPFSLETVILYMPAVISSLIVIPIVLTARLMGHTLVGFFAALLGSIAWSYYNRTMVGYYDTDMFSVLLQFTIFYTLLSVAYKKVLSSIFLAAFFMFLYPYFYPQGMTLIYAMYILLVLYLLAEYKGIVKTEETDDFKETALSLYGSVILLSIPLMLVLPITARIVLFAFVLIFLLKGKLKEKQLFVIALIFFTGFLFFGNVFTVMLAKVMSYLDRGVESQGLHFYQVIQTVREAGTIPFSTMANRISGSQVGVILSLIGYIVLVIRHKPFVIALPLIGVGVLSLWAGLRFTVYAVPVAAISAVYLFYVLADKFIDNTKLKYAFVALATAAMIYPNITHIIGYKVPTVLNKTEVQDLEKLKSISTNKDYTLAWWDYGYPIWFYSNTNTLIDGGKHTYDNYLISQILQSDSQELVANLSRLAVETYVDSNYTIVANTLFKNGKEDQVDPNVFLTELEDPDYKLPKKTRDVYLYLPYRMMNIFPTVAVFGNLDLTTGSKKRNFLFFPGKPVKKQGEWTVLSNGLAINMDKGLLQDRGHNMPIGKMVITQTTKEGYLKNRSKVFNMDAKYNVVYMRDYNIIAVMDQRTFNSTYVQMFMLEHFDGKLFELVVHSPYTKIYRLKK